MKHFHRKKHLSQSKVKRLQFINFKSAVNCPNSISSEFFDKSYGLSLILIPYQKIGFKASPFQVDFLVDFFHRLCYNRFDFARNILIAGKQSETKNRQVGQYKTIVKVAAACEMSARRGQGSVGIPVPLGRGGCQLPNQHNVYGL